MGRNGPKCPKYGTKCPKYGTKWQECSSKSGNGAQMWVEILLIAPNMAVNGRNAAMEVVIGHKCGSKWP